MTCVLVCGGRDFDDPHIFDQAMATFPDVHKLIHGDAPGADTMASQWARAHGIPCVPYPADWDTYDDLAGPMRNEQMLLHGKPDVVVAFPGGSGTQDMVRQALARGVHVHRVRPT